MLQGAFLGAGSGGAGDLGGLVLVLQNRDGGVFAAAGITVFAFLVLPAGFVFGCFFFDDPMESVFCQRQDFIFGNGGGCLVRLQIKLAVIAVEIQIVACHGAGGRICGIFGGVFVGAGDTDIAGGRDGVKLSIFSIERNSYGNRIGGHAVICFGHFERQLQNVAVQIHKAVHGPHGAVFLDVLQGRFFQKPFAFLQHRGEGARPGDTDGGCAAEISDGNGQVNDLAAVTGGTADVSSAHGVGGNGSGHQNQTEDDGHSNHK